MYRYTHTHTHTHTHIHKHIHTYSLTHTSKQTPRMAIPRRCEQSIRVAARILRAMRERSKDTYAYVCICWGPLGCPSWLRRERCGHDMCSKKRQVRSMWFFCANGAVVPFFLRFVACRNRVCIWICLFACVFVDKYVYTYMCMYVCVCVYACMNACVCVYARVCMNICMYVYVYTLTHTCSHAKQFSCASSVCNHYTTISQFTTNFWDFFFFGQNLHLL